MKETNMEHFRGEIEAAGYRFALIDGKIQACNWKCELCGFKTCCIKATVEWLMSEYKPEPVLTAREKGFVECMEGGYIVRDYNGQVKWCEKLPDRDGLNGMWYFSKPSDEAYLFEDCFPFITWDEEPWSIERLRELKVKENE